VISSAEQTPCGIRKRLVPRTAISDGREIVFASKRVAGADQELGATRETVDDPLIATGRSRQRGRTRENETRPPRTTLSSAARRTRVPGTTSSSPRAPGCRQTALNLLRTSQARAATNRRTASPTTEAASAPTYVKELTSRTASPQVSDLRPAASLVLATATARAWLVTSGPRRNALPELACERPLRGPGSFRSVRLAAREVGE
jgi:hypothetical protein